MLLGKEVNIRKASFRAQVSILVTVVTVAFLDAATIPGRWEKVDAQVSGTSLLIHLKSGERFHGFFKNSDSSTLTVVDPIAGERRIAKTEVERIESSAPVRDSLLNGTLIGFASGSGGYLSLHAAICCAPNQRHDLVAAVVIGGIGALIGRGIDAAVRGPELLYEAK